jgi:hypothetical protein
MPTGVYHGVDAEKSQELGWFLPRKKLSYVNYLDSLLIKPSLLNKDDKEVLANITACARYSRNTVILRRKEVGDPSPLTPSPNSNPVIPRQGLHKSGKGSR